MSGKWIKRAVAEHTCELPRSDGGKRGDVRECNQCQQRWEVTSTFFGLPLWTPVTGMRRLSE